MPRGAKVGGLLDSGILKRKETLADDKSELQEKFDEFFGGMVSEWNPCYSDDGQCRYRWDEELGMAEPEVVVTSEERARLMVDGQTPERINVREVLDEVLGVSGQEPAEVDVQPVRRLVAALVQRVARHTKHGLQPPKVGVHACARGKETCPYCRYGFPHDRQPRGGMIMEKGDREGQWHARFPRNDRLCCNYEPHVLLANMGNIDWRPVLNLWAVVQYITKYATKAPKGSRKLQEVLKDAVDEVCTYVPEGEGADFLRRSIQKFFARSLGERDFHAYEAVQLGLQLPLVIPMMPVVSLNTSGPRPLKPQAVLWGKGDDVPVHYESLSLIHI